MTDEELATCERMLQDEFLLTGFVPLVPPDRFRVFIQVNGKGDPVEVVIVFTVPLSWSELYWCSGWLSDASKPLLGSFACNYRAIVDWDAFDEDGNLYRDQVEDQAEVHA